MRILASVLIIGMLASGSASGAASPPVLLESPAGAYYLALKDLRESVPPEKRTRTRYLALYQFKPADRIKLLYPIIFWVNSLTYRRDPVPITVVGNGLLARLDIYELEWDSVSRSRRVADLRRLGVVFAKGDVTDDPWETLAAKDPYFAVTVLHPKFSRGWLDPEVESEVRGMTHSTRAILRADWFLVRTSVDRPEGHYSDFRLHPKSEADLYKSLLIDEKNVRVHALTVGGATKAGVSFVALNPRELELLRGPHGDLWRTYDFDFAKVAADRKGEKNPRRTFRGTVKHDGREIIWELPNGLHGYMLANGAGAQVAAVPPTIAQDQRNDPFTHPRERTVINAWKCVDCHGPESGIIPFRDTITDQMLARGSGLLSYGGDKDAVSREKRRNEDYYREHYLPRLSAGRDAYSGAIKRLNGLDSTTNSRLFVSLIETYTYGTIDREQAAREFGVADGDIKAFLARSDDPDLLFLVDEGPISRSHMELSFKAGMQGVVSFPWETRVDKVKGVKK